MVRAGFAILAVLVAAVLLSGAAYYAAFLAPFLIRAMAHAGRQTAIVISIVTSLGGGYLAIWISLRDRSRSR